MDHTMYFFEVRHEHFRDAVDHFAQFFIAPLFNEDCVDREVRAVHSEHERYLQSDGWRLMQLFRSTSNPAHRFNRFATGSLDTLVTEPKKRGLDARSALIDFHRAHYSSEHMRFCLYGRESLDELRDLAVLQFAPIVNRGVPLDIPSGLAFGA
jgi:insulysin